MYGLKEVKGEYGKLNDGSPKNTCILIPRPWVLPYMGKKDFADVI